MSNLFSRLKSHMVDKGSSYPGGRYMAMMLREVFIDEPGFAREVFGIDGQTYEIRLEFSFKGRQGSRRADLALLDPVTKEPVALLEVKYKDERSLSVRAQTMDYLAFLTRNKNKNLRFRLLSQYLPEESVLTQFPGGDHRAGHMSYAELYHRAERYGEDQRHLNPTLRLFCEFLKEETPVFDHDKIDKAALKLLLVNVLALNNRHRLGRKLNTRERTVEAIGDLEQLLKNMGVLGDEFHELGKDIFGNRPTVYFSASPYFNLGKAKKKIAKMSVDDPEYDTNYTDLDNKLKTGGYLSVTAQYVIRGSAYFWNGISVDLDLSNKTSPLNVSVVAGIGENDDWIAEDLNLPILYDEKKLLKALKKVSLRAVKAGLKDDSLARSTRTALTKLGQRL